MIFTSKYNQKYGNDLPDELNNIIKTLEDGLINSAEKNDIKVFNNLIFYIRDTLFFLTSDNTKKLYVDLVLIPSNIYNHLTEFHQKNLIEVFTIRFSENIRSYEYSQTKNDFTEISYYGLVNLLKVILQNRNVEHFNILMKSLKETMFNSSFDKAKKHRYYFSLTIYFWLLYLYNQKKIDISQYDLSILENILNTNIYEQKEYIFNTYYDLLDEIENGLWGVADWYLEKPPIGEAYFALSPRTWLSFSLVVFLIKFNLLSYNFNIEKVNIKDTFRFELDAIEEEFTNIEKELNLWLKFLYPNMENPREIYNEHKKIVKNIYLQLKNYQEKQFLTKIIETPISKTKIKDFTNTVGDLFNKNAIIPNILKYFGRVSYANNIIEKNGLGEYINMQKSRFAFIDGDYYQSIIGLSDIGARVANFVNQDFFSQLKRLQNQNSPTPSNENLISQIDRFLRQLDKSSNPIIFGNWKSLDILRDHIEYNSSEIPYCHSFYKTIPIINIYDFNKKILILDINSIDYKIYQKEEWYNKELLIEITEPEPDPDNYLKLADVKIKILFKSEIIINNENGYKFFKTE